MSVKINIISKAPGPPAGFPKWGIIIPDFFQFWPPGEFAWWPNGINRVSRPRRNNPNVQFEMGLPSTGIFIGGDRIIFTRDLQEWIHGLCTESFSNPDLYKSDHASLWRGPAFMTNDYGMEKYADWINMTKLANGDPKLARMGCAGTLLKITGESSKEWEFEAVNAYGDYRRLHPSNPGQEHLFFRPGNSRLEIIKDQDGKPIGWDESISVPFSQYQNKAIVPILAKGNSSRARIVKWRVRILNVGEPVPTPWKTRNGFVYPNPYQGLTG